MTIKNTMSYFVGLVKAGKVRTVKLTLWAKIQILITSIRL